MVVLASVPDVHHHRQPSLPPNLQQRRFKKICLLTIVATYGLIAVGALVRAQGAGLGCPDWPKCFGYWIPPTSVDQIPANFDRNLFIPARTWLEYINRLVGVLIGLFIVVTTYQGFRGYRRVRRVLYPTVAALLLVGFQGWLGGRVVISGLSPAILTAHMVVAFVIVGLLIFAYVGTQPLKDVGLTNGYSKYLQGLVVVLGGLLLLQIGLGARLRGALQVIEKTTPKVARSEWLPLSWFPDIAHRQLSILIALVTVVFVAKTVPHWAKNKVIARLAQGIGLCVVLQIVAGLGMAYFAVPPILQVVHVLVASILVGLLSSCGYYMWFRPWEIPGNCEKS